MWSELNVKRDQHSFFSLRKIDQPEHLLSPSPFFVNPDDVLAALYKFFIICELTAKVVYVPLEKFI